MWKATIRGLVARKVRLALTALAILLGVSFVSATYVLTDTVKRSFDAVFAQTLTGVDLQVQGASALGDVSNPGRIPDATIDEVRAVPGVQRAEGFLKTTLATFVDAKGDDDRWRGAAHDRRVVDRRGTVPARPPGGHPPGPRQVAMDAGTAAKHGFARRGRRPGAAQRGGQAVPDRRPVRVRRHHRLRRGHVRRLRPRNRPARVRRRVGHRRGLRAARPGRARPRCCNSASRPRSDPPTTC